MTAPGRAVPLAVLVAAVGTLLASLVWMGAAHPGMHGAGAFRTGAFRAGAGAPASLDDAARAADAWGAPAGLHAVEVMGFDNGYYAELADAAGHRITEVLLDPASGAVRLEYGPAMMWNTATGMGGAGSMMGSRIGPMTGAGGSDAVAAPVDAADAVRLADRWLGEHAAGLRAEDAEHFPGYWTLHTVRTDGGAVVGMLSVNDHTGAIWPHTWHGTFESMRSYD